MEDESSSWRLAWVESCNLVALHTVCLIYVYKTKLSEALSKWAVEALAEALRLELYQNNIKVSILEPGNYLGGTQILNEERVRQLTDK